MHGVGRAVHVEVESEAEEVLVMRRDDVGRDEMAGLRRPAPCSPAFVSRTPLASMMPVSAESTSSDAVLMEDPVDGVVVIADGGDEEDDQLARAPRFVVSPE